MVTAAHSVVPVETLLDLHAYDGESERPDKFEEKGYLLTYIQISCSQVFNYICMARKVSRYEVSSGVSTVLYLLKPCSICMPMTESLRGRTSLRRKGTFLIT